MKQNQRNSRNAARRPDAVAEAQLYIAYLQDAARASAQALQEFSYEQKIPDLTNLLPKLAPCVKKLFDTETLQFLLSQHFKLAALAALDFCMVEMQRFDRVLADLQDEKDAQDYFQNVAANAARGNYFFLAMLAKMPVARQRDAVALAASSNKKLGPVLAALEPGPALAKQVVAASEFLTAGPVRHSVWDYRK